MRMGTSGSGTLHSFLLIDDHLHHHDDEDTNSNTNEVDHITTIIFIQTKKQHHACMESLRVILVALFAGPSVC